MSSSPQRNSEARLAAIVQAAVDAIITIDEAGHIESFNPAAERLFGWSRADILGKPVSLLMPEPDRSLHDEYLQRYLTTGNKRIIGIGRETTGLRSDGTQFPMHLSVAEVGLEPRLFVGIIRDISHTKQAERAREALIRELETKNAELERFTYTVSHDLKSPLITIKGFLGVLEKDADDGNRERMKKDIARIAAASDKMKQLLDDLLELSRVGRITNPPERVSLSQLAEEVVAMLAGPIDHAGAQVSIDAALPEVHADRLRLREVLQNLIENALKFSRDEVDPVIRIGQRAQADSRVPVVFVEDNGRGIDAAYIEKVFGLFEQLEPGGAPGRWVGDPGTGIGLALVKRIVEVHGGRIWAESPGLGRGARFCFTLAPADC